MKMYRRILLKLSGELFGNEKEPIVISQIERFARELIEIHNSGVEIGVVVGGGNFYRGRTKGDGVDMTTADHMGMLGSVMSAINLQDVILRMGVNCKALSPLSMLDIIDSYQPKKAKSNFRKGNIVIFGGGVGATRFTTDTAAALRAIECDCDILLKGTDVDGIYDKDPDVYKDAKKIERTTYDRLLRDRLNVMDMTAFALCRDNNMPIKIFDVTKEGNITRAIKEENFGSVVK